MIKKPTNQKNVNNSGNFITFFKIKNSGKLNQTTAIINASQVQRGIHLSIKDCITGIIDVAFAYIGIQSITDIGTAKGFSFVIYSWKNHSGTYQWIIAQTHTQANTYKIIFLVISKPSFEDSFQTCFQVFFFSSITFSCTLIFQIKSATYFSIFNLQMIYHQSIHNIIQESI